MAQKKDESPEKNVKNLNKTCGAKFQFVIVLLKRQLILLLKFFYKKTL